MSPRPVEMNSPGPHSPGAPNPSDSWGIKRIGALASTLPATLPSCRGPVILLKLTCYSDRSESSLTTRVEDYADSRELTERLGAISGPVSATIEDPRWNGASLLLVLDQDRAHLTFFGAAEEHDTLCDPGTSPTTLAAGPAPSRYIDMGWASYPAYSIVDRMYAIAVASEILTSARLPEANWVHYTP